MRHEIAQWLLTLATQRLGYAEETYRSFAVVPPEVAIKTFAWAAADVSVALARLQIALAETIDPSVVDA